MKYDLRSTIYEVRFEYNEPAYLTSHRRWKLYLLCRENGAVLFPNYLYKTVNTVKPHKAYKKYKVRFTKYDLNTTGERFKVHENTAKSYKAYK